MKQLYLNGLLVIITVLSLTSCNPKYRFVTKGLPETDSSYLVTNRGQRVNANEIIVKKRSLIVDGQEMNASDYKIIKSKKMYFVVDEDKLFLTEIYGKINLLYTLSYAHSYSGGPNGTGTTTVIKSYYLQKQGSPNVDLLTHDTFLEYVSSNPDAVSKVKAHYIWHYASYVPFAGYAVSGIYFINTVASDKGHNNYTGPITALVGSIVLHQVFTGISDHKMRKAISIYNESE